jgi:hypothetical protein
MPLTPSGRGGDQGQMAVLVKPNGPFGEAYTAALGPFLHLSVYPALMQKFGRERNRLGPEKGELG